VGIVNGLAAKIAPRTVDKAAIFAGLDSLALTFSRTA